MAEPADLYDAAAELLDAAGEALSLTAAGCPSRALLSPGPPAWDCCPQLSVHVVAPVVMDTEAGTGSLAPGHRTGRAQSVYVVEFAVTVIRCVPTLDEDGEKLPTAVEITQAAKTTYDDVWALWNYLSARMRDGDLFGPDEREKYLGQATPQPPQGGCAGWVLPVRVQLDGYAPARVTL